MDKADKGEIVEDLALVKNDAPRHRAARDRLELETSG